MVQVDGNPQIRHNDSKYMNDAETNTGAILIYVALSITTSIIITTNPI